MVEQDSHNTEGLLENPERRKLFKRAAIGGGAILATGLGGYAGAKVSLQGRKIEAWPIVDETFKPFPQRNLTWSYAVSRDLTNKVPERNRQFGLLNKQDPNYSFIANRMKFGKRPFDNTKPGMTQKDYALNKASWASTMQPFLKMNAVGQPNTPLYTWEQKDKVDTQYEFESKEDAANSIRSAARLFGAARVGIARRDRRFDYDPLLNIDFRSPAAKDKELSWDEDFPFEPKTVIVMAVPMDYDALAAGPTQTSSAATGDGYTQMVVSASRLASFIQGLGYNAVASGNDLGNSVAYAISAGLGEGGRHGSLIVPGYGPRIRLCKVYTDFEFLEYDEPREWGIVDFCKSCKECAHKCPSKAITFEDDTTFNFVGEHSDQPGYSWSNHEGIKKFHNDSKRCLDYWFESDTDCSACITACTFNEPDYWHHWMIVAANPFIPSPLHAAMSKMHPAFGYGRTEDPALVKKFWETGRGMRVNTSNRNLYGAVGRS